MKHAILGLSLCVVLTVVSGLVQGHASRRWGNPVDMTGLAARLQSIPAVVGDWQVESTRELEPQVRNVLECAGSICRTYQNRNTGETVNVVILLGPAGPMAVHTPEICYSSLAHRQLGPRQAIDLTDPEGREDHFWTLTFQSNTLRGQMLRVYYAWSRGQSWLAAASPRFTLAGQPYLYKIEAAGTLPAREATEKSDPCIRFLREFVPLARRGMAAPSPES